MPNLRRIGPGFSIFLILVSILGLFFYLAGPQENTTTISVFDEQEILIDAQGNEAVDITPLERRELVEYYVYNLSQCLLNRTIEIKLEDQNEHQVTFCLLNSTQFEIWKNGSTSDKTIFHDFTRIQFAFFPEDLWNSYFLVFQNVNDSDAIITSVIEQQFLLQIFDHENSFNWLRIAALSAMASLALQFYFKITVEHVWWRIEHFYTSKKHRKYFFKGGPILTIGLCVAGTFGICYLVFMGYRIDGMFTFVNYLVKDYYYRLYVEAIFVGVIMSFIFMLALSIWDLWHYQVLVRWYPDHEQKRKRDKAWVAFFKKYLTNLYSLIFYLPFIVWGSFVSQLGIEMLPKLIALSAPFLIFIAYVAIKAEFKLQKEVVVPAYQNLDLDFNYYKAGVGSGLLVSVFVVYVINYVLDISKPISRLIIDQGIIVAYSHYNLAKGAVQVINEVKQVTFSFSYIIPLCFLIIYYSLIFFSMTPAYLTKTIKNDIYLKKTSIILKDTLWDLFLFIATFAVSTWIQSQLTPIRYQQILISLTASFIATSFKNSLQALRSSPIQ